MTIPDFDPETGYLPPGRHPCTRDELNDRFVAGFPAATSRPNLFKQLEDQAVHLGMFVKVKKWWIGGSFVTALENPKDLDCAVIIDGTEYDRLESDIRAEIASLTSGPDLWNENHKIDCFGLIAEVPKSHPGRALYYAARGEFDLILSKEDRSWRSLGDKGYLEVEL